MRHPDPFTLRRHAEQLRREELVRIGRVLTLEWSTWIHSVALRFSRGARKWHAHARNLLPD